MKRAAKMRPALLILFIFWFAAPPLGASPADWMPREQDCTQLFWLDGPPRMFGSPSPPASATLCFQFGRDKLLFDTERVRPLEGDWECAVIANGHRFDCAGHMEPKDVWLQPVRFVESGRYFQRVVIEGLRFTDAEGTEWDGIARLEISVWPDRLAFRLESSSEGTLELRYGEKQVTAAKSVLLEETRGPSNVTVESELPVTFDTALGCHHLSLPEKPWSNRKGTYYPEEYLDRTDRWCVTLRNDSERPGVARVMFSQEKHLPITGFTPMLCDPDGTPTGLLVQLSKNWHWNPEKGPLPHDGQWFHGFAWVRVPPKSKRDFVFQMVYARYGGVCAASHAQLCLIGWGHNQFWDQAAIGSFGESICFEPGRVQRRCFITDVRPLMTLPTDSSAKPWGWAQNCGGGDFLMWQDPQGRYQPMKATRTEYRAHGPCLTDVEYREDTTGGELTARIAVSVPRSNDHLRTFVHLRYDVRKPLQWQRLAFFQLGADYYNDTPARLVALGDTSGMRDEWAPKRARGEFDRRAMQLSGEQPWVSVHGVDRSLLEKSAAVASRGVIVRSWKAILGGKEAGPHVSFFCTEWGAGNHRTVAELAPPPDVSELKPGDFVDAELELVVFPAQASDYYGPDAALREALSRDADTWRMVHREASLNGLKPTASRGRVLQAYPLVVAVDNEQGAELTVEGGVGHIPVTFTGLISPRDYKLHVNERLEESWQTDWDPVTERWKMIFNVQSSTAGTLKIRFAKSP